MKHILILILVMAFGAAAGQLKGDRLKGDFSPSLHMQKAGSDLSWVRTTPVLTTVSSDLSVPAVTYWQGMSYTRYSANGRFRSTYLFDVQGTLRESRASYSLKKTGILSNWRVQFSPQRNRPQFIYTIR
jgi:hypothetical protein